MKLRDKVSFKRSIFILIAFAVGLACHFYLTAPKAIDTREIKVLSGVRENGERIFYAAGCGSCHLEADGPDKLMLSGGRAFETKFGTFYAPNVSMSKEFGIGEWSLKNFYHAI